VKSGFARTSKVICFAILPLSAGLWSSACSQNDSAKNAPANTFNETDLLRQLDGETWLRLDKSARLAFIVGNLRGYFDGQAAGCGEAKLLAKSLPSVSGLSPGTAEDMRFQCVSKFKPSRRPFESYEEVITDFYSRYPEDRTIDIPEVLGLLAYDSDAKLTADDIHKGIRISK